MLARLRDRLAASRLLRLVGVCFLVPVVVLSNPTTAAASTTGVARYHFDGWEVEGVGLGWADCQVAWSTLASGQIAVSSASRCDGGPDTTPGVCQSFEAGCGSYGWVIKNAAGSTCGSTGMVAVSADGDGVKALRTHLVASSVLTMQDQSSCLPAEACLSYYWDGAGPGAHDVVQCTPIEVDPPEVVAEGECEYGEPSGPPRVGVEVVPSSRGGNWKFDTIKRQAGVTLHQTGGSDWVLYVVTKRAEFRDRDSKGYDGNLYGIHASSQQKWGNGTLQWDDRFYPTSEYDGTPPGDRVEVVGYGLYRTNWDQSGGTAYIWQADVIGPQNGRVGRTNPAECMWYWGTRVAPDLPDGSEDPISDPDVVTPPVPDPDPPAPTPPDDESSNWLYLIWKALQSIFTSLLGLPAKIANLIIDGVKKLFVPTVSLRSATNDVKDAYEDKFPFNFGSVVESMGTSSSSGKVSVNGGTASSGCPDWNVKVAGQSWSAVCDSSFTAAVRSARPFLAAGMLTVAFWPLVRGVFYAAVPLVKPTPTSEGGK